MNESTDDRFIGRALELAHQGEGLASPNPCVGAVVASGSELLGEGTHLYAERKHAEIVALERAGARARGATLYLTLEPCCHIGRTGPCVEAVIAAGVRRVVACMADPNPAVAGKGFERLRAAGVEITVGIGESEARKLNEAFARWIRTRCPLVTLKAALTLDGKIAQPPETSGNAVVQAPAGGDHQWITGELARAHVQELRHRSDAILVGIGTVLADNPLLTDRSGKPRRRPLLRVVLDSKLRLPMSSRLVQSVREDLLLFCAAEDSARQKELECRGVRVVPVATGVDGSLNLREIIRRLGEMQITSLLVEGGSLVHGTVLREHLADKLFLYYAPRLLGSGAPLFAGAGFKSMANAPVVRCVTLHRFGEDFAVEGYLKDPYGDPAA